MSRARGRKPRPSAGPSDARRADPPPITAERGAAPSWPLSRFLPTALGLALVLFGVIDGGADHPVLLWSVAGAGLALMAWNALLLSAPRYRSRGLQVTVDVRKQHYLQACAQMTIFIYWGFHLDFPLVRDHLPHLAVQLAFAYGFDMLLSWSRRGRYSLGFGPFPVIFSINLFLWFKPEWFFLQLAMVAVGFAAKDLVRWNRDGRPGHIFNPSSFPLAITSVVLILAGASDLTYGGIIANSQAIPPHMHMLIFLVALPGQILFGVASMTVSAVVTTYLCGRIYLAATGSYYFFDCYLPIPVFLGMHLLFTDPSTSPRTELGRIFFGILYGLSTVALYPLLLVAGAPAFYDKLLQVPLLNLSVRMIDRAAGSRWLAPLAPERLGRSAPPRWRYLAYTALWVATFAILSVTGGLGDRHPGQYLPFWIQRCERGDERACAYLAMTEQQLCGGGSGWACNEAAILGPRSRWGLEAKMDASRKEAAFRAGCELGFEQACRNGPRVVHAHPQYERAAPTLADWPLLLRGSRLGPVTDHDPAALYARACAQGWPGTCDHHEPAPDRPPPSRR